MCAGISSRAIPHVSTTRIACLATIGTVLPRFGQRDNVEVGRARPQHELQDAQIRQSLNSPEMKGLCVVFFIRGDKRSVGFESDRVIKGIEEMVIKVGSHFARFFIDAVAGDEMFRHRPEQLDRGTQTCSIKSHNDRENFRHPVFGLYGINDTVIHQREQLQSKVDVLLIGLVR